MHIGILGAAFNPPHIGHMLIAQQVLDFSDIERIWWLPVYKHTFDKSLVDVVDRVAMLSLLKMLGAQLSTLEIDNRLDGNTINLLPILRQQFPNDHFTFIIGSDNLPTFHKWGKWQELLRQLPFLVVERAGYPLKPLYQDMKILEHPLFITTNISSTLVRARIKTNLSIDHLVTGEVRDYIEAHKLYAK